MKPAIFIDAYLNSPEREEIFKRNVQNFIDAGYDLFIISNKINSFDKFEQIKYFEYDCRNRLLNDRTGYLPTNDSDYLYYSKKYTFDSGEKHTLSMLSPIFNTTNLSVLYNTRRICEIAKEFGYTNILRVEYDCIFESYDLENTLLKGYDTEDWNNYGLAAWGCYGVYTNFMYLNIDYFLSNIPLIKTDYQYKDFIQSNFGELKYFTFEKIIALKLKKIKVLSREESVKYVIESTNMFTSSQTHNRYNFYSGKLIVVTMNNHTQLIVDSEYSNPINVTLEFDNESKNITLPPGCFYLTNIKDHKNIRVKHNNLVKYFDTSDPCPSIFKKDQQQ